MEILVEGQLDYFEDRSWKKRYFVMKYEISSSLRYIEIYKDKHWQKQLPRHVVNLHPGYEVRRKSEPKKKHCFSVQTTDHTLLLSSEDENVITQWMETLEEYNLVKSFCVQPQDTPTMAKIDAVLPCHLQLVHSEVRLVSAMDGNLLGLWPFKCIRRYKFVGNLFSIEAGRKAPTGEGTFEFISNECSEIYRIMDTIIRTKAGNSPMRRLASERLSNQIQQEHQSVRKVNSVPFPSKKEVHYDYADPAQTTVSRPPVPPTVLLPSMPELPLPKTDPTYDMLSPGIESTKVDGKPLKQNETPSNEYNTLKFANAKPVEAQPLQLQKVSKMAGSAGSYDTLKFTEDTASSDTTLKTQGLDKQYDTLQFGDNHGVKNRSDENELTPSSVSFYDKLDHSSGSFGSISSNTYDSLHSENRPPSGEMSDAYDTIKNPLPDAYDTIKNPLPPTSLDLGSSTYDTLWHENKKTTGKDSPDSHNKPTTPGQGVVPAKPMRPPPRRKPPSIPKQPEAQVKRTSDPTPETKPSLRTEAPPRKITPGAKPEKPIKPPRKNTPEAKDVHTTKSERMSEVIQKRFANPQPPVDDGGYASVDHEYTTIDYSKVSRSDIYTDPDQDDTRRTPITKPTQPAKPAKPARNNPKPKKNLFKKTSPKPFGEGGNFADELKKKLEIKLMKKGGHKQASTSQTHQSGIDDSIYDEVVDPYYSEPDPYSEPAV